MVVAARVGTASSNELTAAREAVVRVCVEASDGRAVLSRDVAADEGAAAQPRVDARCVGRERADRGGVPAWLIVEPLAHEVRIGRAKRHELDLHRDALRNHQAIGAVRRS